MPGLDFDGAIYVKSVPEYRVEAGLLHVCYKVGGASIEFVMRPSIFLKALRAAKRAADEFHGKGQIVAMRSDKA